MSQAEAETLREAVGVFADPDSLEQAAERLQRAGFDEKRLTLLTTDSSVEAHLDHLFESSRGAGDEAFAPRTTGDDASHGIGRGLAFTGQTVAAGAVVVSAAALGGPVVTALAGAAAVGSVGAAMVAIIKQGDADELQEHLDQGHLLLFARLQNEAEESAARDALGENSLDVRIIEISSTAE